MSIGTMRVFLGSEDFEVSLGFYQALGFTLEWRSPDLAEFTLGDNHFYLQRFYQPEWCGNTMLHVTVDDAQAWHDRAVKVLDEGGWGKARAAPPTRQDYGAKVAFIWDPSEILWHMAEYDPA